MLPDNALAVSGSPEAPGVLETHMRVSRTLSMVA